MNNRTVTRRVKPAPFTSNGRIAAAGGENGRPVPQAAPAGALAPEESGTAPEGTALTHAALWAQMDELAERVTALWPRGRSAAEAVSAARRAR